MAFHPYPPLIRWLFNARRVGPPVPVTAPSPWPWIDHSVSRLPRPTIRPYQTRFRYGSSAKRINLAGHVQLVGSLYKRHVVITINKESDSFLAHCIWNSFNLLLVD